MLLVLLLSEPLYADPGVADADPSVAASAEAQTEAAPADAAADPAEASVLAPLPDALRGVEGRFQIELTLSRDDIAVDDARVLSGSTSQGQLARGPEGNLYYRTENQVTEVVLGENNPRRATSNGRVCVDSDETMRSEREIRLFASQEEGAYRQSQIGYAEADPSLVLSGDGQTVYTQLEPGDSITIVQASGGNRRSGERVTLRRGRDTLELHTRPDGSELCFESGE